MSLWRNRDFLRVYLGQMLSVVGDGVYYVAVAWWIKTQTGSDALIATLALCVAIPEVIFGIFGGVVADRYDRRRVMIGSDLARSAALLVPAILFFSNRLEAWHLCAAGVLLGTASAFFFPALTASLPQMVPAEQLTEANSVEQSSFALGGILGPALGGMLVALVGAGTAILINAVSFAASALLIAASTIPSPERNAEEDESVLAQLHGGFAFLKTQPLLLGILLHFSLLNLIASPIPVLLPGLARDVLHTDVRGFGLLEAMLPTGFIIGGLLMSRIHVRRIGPLVLLSMLMAGLLFGAVGFSRNLALSAGLIALTGMAIAVLNILVMLVFQTRIPAALQGRVFGMVGTLSQGLRPLGLAVSAPLIAVLGSAGLISVCGGLLALLGPAGAIIPGILSLEASPVPDDSSETE